jgi:hypothetical protein
MAPSGKAVGTAVVGTCTVIGTVFAGMQVFGWGATSGTGPTTTITESPQSRVPSETQTSNQPPPTSTSDAEAVSVGQCLLGDRLSPCDDAHDGQVVRIGGACDTGAFVSFAGGDPMREIIGAAVTMRALELSGVRVCAVRMASPQSISAQGILATSKGDFARRCFHDFMRQEVGCDVPHTREAVGVRPSGVTYSLDCQAAATGYLGIEFQRFANDLALERSVSSLGTTCWVKARGYNVLTESIRSVGAKSLPLRAVS